MALLKLLGTENYFEDNNTKEVFKLHNQHSLFFRPEKLFEWVVYDRLIEKYGENCITRELYTGKNYVINETTRESTVDFVVHSGNEIIVIDAKWKILESVKKIAFEDIAKLRRDVLLHNATKAILIYPQIEFDEREMKLSIDDFCFEIDQCEMLKQSNNYAPDENSRLVVIAQ